MLQLPETLVHHTASACLADLQQAVSAETGESVTVDAAALVRFDSTALAVLLALRRASQQTGKTLKLLNMPSRLTDLATLYGIAELLSAQS